LDRYGDHLIPVKSAQNIAKAAAKRLKEAKAKAVAFADEDSSEDHALTLDELNELSPETVVSLGTNTDTGFVRLADVFPPCPPKGEFDVNKIRASQYFFS
jgi:DNA-directed RNA polymerase